MVDVANALTKLLSRKELMAISKITQARILYVAIELSNLDTEDKKIVLDIWENKIFKIYGLMNKESRNYQERFIRLATQI